MSKPQSSRPTTRAKNVFSHPGAIVQKQKRRSREEMVQERAEKEAEVEKKTKRKLAGIARIAEIEERMAAKDSNAKLTPARPSHPLRRTSSHAFIPLIAPHSDGDGGETATSVPESDEVNSASDSDLVSTDVEKPPTKKSKTATSVRTAIEAAREGAANTRKVEGQGKHADKIGSKKGSEAVKPVMHTWETATKETVQPLAVKGKPSGLTYRPSGLTRTGTSVFNPSGLARNVNVYPSHKKVPALTKANNGFSYHEISSDSEKEKVSDAPLSDWLDDNEDAEREAAVTSPVKVKQRLTSTAIVKIEPGTTEPAQVPKLENPTRKVPKFTNASLPEGCLDEHVWRRVVVPTYLQYAASCDDPWVISDENAIKAMQKIWNTIYERKIKHTVSSISPVFRVLSQRLYEWRSSFGVSALNVLNAFFETGDEHKTDEQRNEFATHMLNDLRFLYAHTQGDDKAGWRGIFRSELVLKAFTTHLIAIQGGRYIRELGTPNEMCPRAALALSVTAVERALTLWIDGQITIQSIEGDQRKGRNGVRGIVKGVNLATGRESAKALAFGDTNWGEKSRLYMSSVMTLSSRSWDKFIEAVQPHLKARLAGSGRSKASVVLMDEDKASDQRAQLIDLSDDDN